MKSRSPEEDEIESEKLTPPKKRRLRITSPFQRSSGLRFQSEKESRKEAPSNKSSNQTKRTFHRADFDDEQNSSNDAEDLSLTTPIKKNHRTMQTLKTPEQGKMTRGITTRSRSSSSSKRGDQKGNSNLEVMQKLSPDKSKQQLRNAHDSAKRKSKLKLAVAEIMRTPRRRVPPLDFWSNQRLLNGQVIGGKTPDPPRWSEDVTSAPTSTRKRKRK